MFTAHFRDVQQKHDSGTQLNFDGMMLFKYDVKHTRNYTGTPLEYNFHSALPTHGSVPLFCSFTQYHLRKITRSNQMATVIAATAGIITIII
jgi:hypothetical protein